MSSSRRALKINPYASALNCVKFSGSVHTQMVRVAASFAIEAIRALGAGAFKALSWFAIFERIEFIAISASSSRTLIVSSNLRC